MYSVNVPVPWAVRERAAALEPALTRFASVRDRFTLVVKRLDGRELEDLHRVRERLRRAVRGVAPFTLRVTGVDVFESPPLGEGPVVYLAVEGERTDSDADPLGRLHERLVREFGAVDGLEREDYVPHVTLARGWADRGAGRGADPDEALARVRERFAAAGGADLRWRVEELGVWSREYKEIAARLPLRG